MQCASHSGCAGLQTEAQLKATNFKQQYTYQLVKANLGDADLKLVTLHQLPNTNECLKKGYQEGFEICEISVDQGLAYFLLQKAL